MRIKMLIMLGLALLVVSGTVIVLVPAAYDRVERVSQRLETWWHEQQPHELTVPPPSDVDSQPISPSARPSTPEPALEPASAATTAPTVESTRQVLPTATPRPTPSVVAASAPAEYKLKNFKHDYQRFNNCGPTTLGMLLSHFGLPDTQYEIAPALKPNPNDKNISPDELVGYAHTKPGLEALFRVNGNLDLLKQLIANGFPVVVETWFTPKPNDGMGHYRLLFAYSDPQQKFFALDSYNGPNVSLAYPELDADWKVFNRTYLIAYTRDQSEHLSAILGDALDDRLMWSQSRAHVESALAANPNDAFEWFNLGSTLTAQNQFAEAVKAFDTARKLGLPWRMLWYQFSIFDAYLAAGRIQDVLDLTAANLRQASDLEESHYYRGRALQALGKTDDAIKSYREALRLNKNYQAAAKALQMMGQG